MPSWNDMYDLGLYAALMRRPGLVVHEGDVFDALLCAGATIGDYALGRGEAKFRATYLDGADGDDLTEEARDRGVTRDEGAAAIGQVSFARLSAAAGAGTIPAGTRVATEPDETGASATYTLDADVAFGALALSAVGQATCTEVGSAGNAEPATITRILDTVFDTSITVSNADRFVGGAERQSDEDLRDETRGFYLTRARGTVDAIVQGAKQVRQVKRVTVDVSGIGEILVYVADANGNGNDTMTAAVTAELANWAGAADVYSVIAGEIYEQPVQVTLTVRAGVSIAGLVDRVVKAIVARLRRLRPGETLARSIIAAAALEVDRERITNCTVVVPAADVTPTTANQSIRATVAGTTVG